MNKTKNESKPKRKNDRFKRINVKTQHTVLWYCRWRSVYFRILRFIAHPSVSPCFGQFSVLLTCQDINDIICLEFNLSRKDLYLFRQYELNIMLLLSRTHLYQKVD